MIFSKPPKQLNKSWEAILHPSNSDYKEWLQKLWKNFEPYAAPSFKNDLESDEGKLDSLTWEMFLANILLESDFTLKKSDNTDEPDLCILDGDRRIWIECCIPEKGDQNLPDSVQHHKCDGAVHRIDKSKSTLRCAGALRAKKEQYEKWVKKGVCHKDEPFIIAIHGKQIDFDTSKDKLPDILRALYAMGDAYMTFYPNGEKESESGYNVIPEIQKTSGAAVETSFFSNGKNPNISGVIFSNHWYGHYCSHNPPEFCFIENMYAKNKCLLNFEKFAQVYNYIETGKDQIEISVKN